MTDVSVLMVSYNTRELTLATLRSLPAACASLPGTFTDVKYEVIVVDNASTDGSGDAVCAEFPEVTVALSPDNLGFARAVNLAAEKAIGRYLLLLNPDTEPDGPFVSELVRFADAHPERRIYAGRTLRTDGTDDGRAGFGLPSLWSYTCFATGLSSVFRRWRLTNPEELPHLDRSLGGPVPAVSGCVLLIDRDFFTTLHGFAPEFFMYSEDIDLSYRAGQLGAQPTLVPTARVRHVGGASSTSARKLEMLLRGKVTFVNRHWSPGRARLGRALLVIGVALRACAPRPNSPWRQAWRDRSQWTKGWVTV